MRVPLAKTTVRIVVARQIVQRCVEQNLNREDVVPTGREMNCDTTLVMGRAGCILDAQQTHLDPGLL
jgi:hypothetical protein